MKVQMFVLGGLGDWNKQTDLLNEFLKRKITIKHIAQSSSTISVQLSSMQEKRIITHLTIFYEE